MTEQFLCLDPQQPIRGHYLLEASAGTGKTFTIEHLVLRMVLLEKIPLEKILIVTFTRAATRELKRRIQEAFERVLFSLKGEEKNPFPYLENVDKQKVMQRAQLALGIIEQASIFTIHGFCFFLLSQFAIECGFALKKKDPLNELNHEKILQQIVSFIKTRLKSPLIQPCQLKVLFGTRYKKDIQALVHGIYRLATSQKNFPAVPSFFAELKDFSTFFFNSQMPPSFLEEMERVRPFFKDVSHQAIARSLKKQALLMDRWKENREISPQEFDEWIYEQRKKQGGILESFTIEKLKSGKEYPHHAFEQYEQFTAKIKKLVDPDLLLYQVADKARKHLATFLEKEDLLTPDALLTHLHRSIKNKKFAEQAGSLFDALIIDEFQDTDSLQWEIFKTLFLSRTNPVAYCYLVGDPKQSIYGFRGADLNVYQNACRFLGEKARKKLSVNYRSDADLVYGLNAFFLDSSVQSRLIESGLQDSFPYYEVGAANEGKWGLDGKHSIHIPLFGLDETNEPEQEEVLPYIAYEILNLHRDHAVPFSDIAVLVRDRFQSSRVHKEFSKYQIPHQAHLQKPLYETEVFTFLELYFKLLEDPFDRNAMLTLLLHPLLENTYEGVAHEKMQHTLQAEILSISEQWKEGKKSIALDSLLHLPLGSTTLKTLFAQGKNKQKRQDFLQILEYLLEGVSLKEIKAVNPDLDERVLQKTVSQPGAVQVLTIHKSKGLEYPFVFCIGINQPYKKVKKFIDFKMQILSKDEQQGKTALHELQAEKLRLLYVGLTRAKHRLYIPFYMEESKDNIEQQSALETLIPGSLKEKQKLLSRLEEKKAISLERPQFPLSISPYESESEEKKIKYQRLVPHWSSEKMLSFTQLTSGEINHQIDSGIESSLPAGTSTGILIHDIIENALKSEVHRSSEESILQNFVQRKVQATPLKKHEKEITQMLQMLWDYPFTATDAQFKLKQIGQRQLFTEADFTMHYEETWLKGFIDLIAFHEKKVYLFDWKTNLLANYENETLEKAMLMHQYTMQADLYAKALDLYLKPFEGRYELGGVFYVFLRGFLEDQPKGVYHYQPKLNRSFAL